MTRKIKIINIRRNETQIWQPSNKSSNYNFYWNVSKSQIMMEWRNNCRALKQQIHFVTQWPLSKFEKQLGTIILRHNGRGAKLLGTFIW